MKISKENIFEKALNSESINFEEALYLYLNVSLADIVFNANIIRFQKHKEKCVSWIIDRNVNISNACYCACKFCNFHKKVDSQDVYITSIEEYKVKINELIKIGGNQLLLQGGMNPKLKLSFYIDLFMQLKKLYPKLKLHALGPPEIHFLSKNEGISYKECLELLINAGLDSLPGAGAEILSNRVRKLISPAKCTVEEWSEVMIEAHKLNLTSSATMMFGHVETINEIIDHLLVIRDIQSIKPNYAKGFISFIPWPFQSKNTKLAKDFTPKLYNLSTEYIKLIAISRIVLNNFQNIQASWLTVGSDLAKVCLHAGANDMGSIMIEENVVSAAGANNTLNCKQMQEVIAQAGFIPKLRNQQFEYL